MIKRLGMLAAFAVVSLAFASAPAFATGTQNPTLTVKTAVITNCTTMSSQTLNFGSYDPLGAGPYNGSAAFSTKCSSGDTVSFNLDNGGSYGSAGGSYTSLRAMTDGSSHYLAYHLCSASCTGSNDWSNSGSYASQTGAGVTGSALTWTVYGQIPTGQDVPAASQYQDTVTVTLNY